VETGIARVAILLLNNGPQGIIVRKDHVVYESQSCVEEDMSVGE
jgi:hypothetical protein